MKQTEKQPKQLGFRFVSVRTENFDCLFRGHPNQKSLNMVITNFLEIGRYGVQIIRHFTLILIWGFLSLNLAPFKSKSQKSASENKVPKNRVIWL
jgi:hypothetical protein